MWNSKKYYQNIAKTEDFSHPGFLQVIKLCRQARSVLDVGCGDGSKLARIGNSQTARTGCDISRAAVKLGRKKFPKINFSVVPGEKLPYADNQFENIVSFFTIEHTQDPELFVSEMVRVTKPKGRLFILAPNYGAPNRASPNFRGSRVWKMLAGIVQDFFSRDYHLTWNHVESKVTSFNNFKPDSDTTVEPYLRSLICYLQSRNIRIAKANSYWEMERGNAWFWQKILRFLGEKSFFPFEFWGPHIYLSGEKL